MKSEVVNITQRLLDFASGVTEGFSNIGIGIGAIMLLIVALYYITSILDGGKFQMKMLIPVCIFFLVCHFTWISKPVISFTTTITEALCTSLKDIELQIKEREGLPASATLGDAYLKANTPKDGEDLEGENTYLVETGQADKIYDKPENNKDANDNAVAGLVRDTKGERQGMIAKGVHKGFNSVTSSVTSEFSSFKKGELQDSPAKFSIKSFICVVFGAICRAFSYVYNAFGALMSSIIIAFGPITFAFAIMPGQGGTIKSWFIRLCQFSLYSPLSTLVNCFCTFLTTTLFNLNGDNSATGDFAMCLGMEICCLVALVSIPSIASMIIEGASGAVSLSQGLQAIAGGLTSGATTAGGLFTLAAGKDNKVSNFMAGAKEMGISGLASSFSKGGGMSGGFGSMVSDAISKGTAARGGK